MKLWKIVLYAAVIAVFASCSNYKFVTQSDVIYLDEVKGDSINLFTSLNFNTITLDFKPRFYRNSDWYWGRSYSYWNHRPLWLDYNFMYDPWHFGYYSYFYRPWNYWDWYMRPWRPTNNWTQGPFNNPGYNVVYNSSRRTSRSLETAIANNRAKPRVKPTVVIPRVKPQNNYKPKPIQLSRPKPINNYKPSNNYSRPSYNSTPSYSKPSYSPSMSKPSNNNISRGNGSTGNRGIN
jgi:hypothetical protein